MKRIFWFYRRLSAAKTGHIIKAGGKDIRAVVLGGKLVLIWDADRRNEENKETKQ